MKVVDSTTFTVSKTIAAVEVTVEPGAMRLVHKTYFQLINDNYG